MEPPRGTPVPDPTPDEAWDAAHDTGQTHPMELDVDDPALEAWLVEREFELEEMAWALADQFTEDWRP